MSATIYTQQHLSEHLLGYWPLNKTAENLINPARFGQYTSTDITYVSGKIKNAASFNGTTSESIQPNINLEGLTEMTVSCWIKPDTINKYAFICSQWYFANNTTFAFSKYTDGQLVVHIADSNNDNPGNNYMFSTNANLQVGVWTHVLFVYDGKLIGNTNRVKIYQNGVQLTTTMGLGNIASRLYGTHNFLIGDLDYTDNTLKFDGDIEALAVWGRALQPEEISRMYSAGKGFQLMPTPGYDSDAQDWFDLMTPMPTTPFKFAINEVFKGLKQYGIWEKLDYLLLMATETQQQSLIPIKNHNLFIPVNVNSMQWIENVGYVGAVGKYLNTDFKPALDGINYQKDDASYGHFLIKFQSGIGGANGCWIAPGTWDVNCFFTSTQLSFAVNDSSGTIAAIPTKLGLVSLVRQSSSHVSAYFNGTLINNYAKGSAGVPNIDYYVAARNANGGPGEYGVDETHAAVYFGSSTINFSAFNEVMQDYALRRIGLVAFYPLNGNAFDSIYSSHGSQTIISYAAGKHDDYGALFNGVNGFINVPYTAKLNAVTTDMSLSVWVKTNSLTDKIVLIKYMDAPGNGEYFITLSSNKWKARLAGGTYDVTSINDAVIDSWTHLVFTAQEGGDLKFYVNNVLQGTTSGLTGILPGNNFDLSLGKWTTAFWNGMLQDLGIWNRVLNEYEIARLYNSGNGFKVY